MKDSLEYTKEEFNYKIYHMKRKRKKVENFIDMKISIFVFKIMTNLYVILT